jgi:hypothetical protein
MMPCPRRAEAARQFTDPATDAWKAHHRSHDNLVCSYCGSLHPDEFMAAVRAGHEIVPTDKNYKAYVDLPGNSNVKFYYQHLTDVQKTEFIALINARVVKIGHPGYFYVTPYFASRIVVDDPDAAAKN